ncbi:MAG: DHH family phosphoesterase [Halobacteriales archaeon]
MNEGVMDEEGAPADAEYAILGCGSVGTLVARRLVDEGRSVVIFDMDESRVEALRDQDLNAIEKDITDDDLPRLISSTPVALVLTSYVDDNEVALHNLKEENPDQYVIVRATDPVSHDHLEAEGADYVINPPQVIAESALRALDTGELEHRARQLVELLEGGEDAAAVVYRSFEPDSIAAAAAIQAIASQRDVDADVVYYGDHRHSRGDAFANIIGVDVRDVSTDELGDYDSVVVIGHVDVDDDPGFDVDAWIDHDETDAEVDARYTDVGANVGSNSTTLTRYVQEVGIDASDSRDVLTGLLHGIRTRTSYFRRNATPSDLRAAAYLYPLADHDLLEEIESTSVSPEEFDVLAESIRQRRILSSNLVSNVGFINDIDALARAADRLLGFEGISTTVVFGVVDDSIHVAAKSNDVRVDVEGVLKQAFEWGEVVGHADEAMASVPLGLFAEVDDGEDERETLLELVDETVANKVLRALNVEDE